jgi:hypothetical protein
MNHASFDMSIVQAHKCKIIGWISKFVNPSEIGVIEQLCTLRDAWACGSAQWVRLTPAQVKAHMEGLEERIESGEITVKVRKLRSDAGQSRGGKCKASEKENAQASRKPKRTQMQLPPKSKAIIFDDEEDEEDGEGISE